MSGASAGSHHAHRAERPRLPQTGRFGGGFTDKVRILYVRSETILAISPLGIEIVGLGLHFVYQIFQCLARQALVQGGFDVLDDVLHCCMLVRLFVSGATATISSKGMVSMERAGT